MGDATHLDDRAAPLWPRGLAREPLAPLTQSLEADVAIAGGGITGVTTALLAARAGLRVVLLEADQLGGGTTGATSAHVTAVPDVGYDALLRQHGVAAVTSYVAQLQRALDAMGTLVREAELACDWAEVPAYWLADVTHDLDRLRAEQRAAERLGLRLALGDVPLPWATAGGLEIPGQARFHPLRYLLGVAALARAAGARLFEQTPVLDWQETADGVVVHAPAASLHARALVLATHTPLGVSPVQAELRALQSSLIAVAAPAAFPDVLCWDTATPYHYLRPLERDGRRLLLIGGADRRTGQDADPPERYAELLAYARARLGTVTLEAWWSAQLFEPADGLPYIGRAPLARRVYLATGFAGVGLVQGTMAAQLLAAMLPDGEQREAPWAATRLPLRAVPHVLAEGAGTAATWVGDRLARAEHLAPERLGNGEGRIATLDGQRRALYRDGQGRLHVLSPVCPHLGCLVRWNGSAGSWDCPCHGSRFAPTGEVLEGPALSGLARAEGSAPYAGMAPITPDADAIRLDADKG